MSRELVIDGYNLLHAAGLARRHYGPGDLERSRLNLLRLIADQMSDQQRRRTTFVFDARDPPPDASGMGTHAEMLVLYALHDEEADDMIERIIAAHSAPRNLVVVSSDHRLHKAAKRRKAFPIDSDVFLDECARRVYCRQTPRAEPESKPGADVSPAELAEWLSVFDIDPRELADEVDLPTAREAPRRPGPSEATQKQRPKREKRSRRRSGRMRPPPIAEDLSFWEARIAELFRRRPDEFGEGG